jgi:hypothetical protein
MRNQSYDIARAIGQLAPRGRDGSSLRLAGGCAADKPVPILIKSPAR